MHTRVRYDSSYPMPFEETMNIPSTNLLFQCTNYLVIVVEFLVEIVVYVSLSHSMVFRNMK
jgi:hypothetical protein